MLEIGVALGLFFILEGLMPFIAPRVWKESFRRILEMSEGQIRFAGLIAISVGLVVLLFFTP